MSGKMFFSSKLSLIAAADKKMGIGKNGNLPWKLVKEMAYFNKMTRHIETPNKQNAVIMGRKTWDSIPTKYRPLVGRLNIVLSKTMEGAPMEGVLVFPKLNDAMVAIENNYPDIERIWVIGGTSVYKEAMQHPSCHRVYLTEIDGDFDCDTFFPEIPTDFVKLSDHGNENELVPREKQTDNGVEYYFRIYQRE